MSLPNLKVVIKDTDQLLYEGEADRISSFNEMGRFDVLPQHANFISMIKQELRLFLHHQQVKELKIDQAIMKVKQDAVHIFLGIETFALPDELSIANVTRKTK